MSPARQPRPRDAQPARHRGSGDAARRRTVLSADAVLDAAVALLDESGESGLTFRSLAARLGGGVASIYWYVSNRDELLDRATDRVLADVSAGVAGAAGQGDPIDELRTLALNLFEVIQQHPWTSGYIMREPAVQGNALRLYERLGEQVMRLGLPPRETFHAVSAVFGFVIGAAIDLGQKPPESVTEGDMDRAEFLANYAERWRSMDVEEFPYLHYVVAEFAGHDDDDQFRAGLDILLAGLRRS